MITLTNQQARRFILLKQGLLGEYRFIGKQGALDYIKQAGCIQFDPVDVCGKNTEITLLSRVKGFTKHMLHALLYEDRALFDYPDKQLSVIPTEYWPYFTRLRKKARKKLDEHPEIAEHIEIVRAYIQKNGAVCSDDLTLEGSTNWWSAINWSAGGKFSRSVLEQMYSSGDLIVHHKKGTRRYYDLAERYIPLEILNAAEPLTDDFAHQKWRILRRIGAVGLIWNRPSDAWLSIWELDAGIRNSVFTALIDENAITEVLVEGLSPVFYICASDKILIDTVLQNEPLKPRTELIAPLDPFMWDRKLINAIFGYKYAWEIYMPPQKRKYGAYVLPLLCGEKFIGRVEAVCERAAKTLAIKNIWYEEGVKQTKKLDAMLDRCFKRFARFNDCDKLSGVFYK